MGNINFNDVKESLNHGVIHMGDTFQDAMNDFLNKRNDSVPDYISSLSKQMNTLLLTTITPKYLVKEFIAKCDAISAELYMILQSWIRSISEKASAIANDFTPDALLQFYDEEPENIANLLIDTYMKYNDILLEVPKLAEELKAFPPVIKEVADASNKLYNEFDAVKKDVYAVCAAFDIGSDKFDKALARKLIRRAKYPKSAGDKDAQPTE